MTKQMKFGLVMLATAVLSVASLVNARGWVQNGSDWYYTDSNDEIVTETIQASGNSKFYLGEDGAMQRDFFLEDDGNGNTYYFGSNGAMVTNTWVAIDSSILEDPAEYIPDAYWYYFGANGRAIKGKSTYKTTKLDGKMYVFDEKGMMCTGWVGDSGTVDPDEENPFAEATYYCGGDNDGVVRTGWVSYYDGYDTDDDDFRGDLNTLYFFFNEKNGKKYAAEDENTLLVKKINQKKYAFNNEGIMLSGWDAYESVPDYFDKPRYFSGEDDGHMVQRGWVYAVPGESIDSKAHDEDEEKYMYFQNNGNMYQNVIKKINGKFYAFDQKGIMKTGLVMFADDSTSETGTSYLGKVDLDEATGEDATKKGVFKTSATAEIELSWNGTWVSGGAGSHTVDDAVKIHYFGSDGARRVGANVIEFSDNNYTFVSKNSGNFASGETKKKFYSLGFLAAADPDIKFGLYAINNTNAGIQPLEAQVAAFNDACNSIADGSETYIGYNVLGTSGSKVKGNNTAKKDADGNYWMIDPDTNFLIGIYQVPVKKIPKKQKFTFKSVLKGKPALADVDAIAELQVYVNGASTQKIKDVELIAETYPGESTYGTQFNNTNFTLVDYSYSSLSNAKKGDQWSNLTVYLSGYFYQSDYNGKTTWIPVGVKDQSGSTVHIFDYAPTTGTASSKQTHSVLPDNSYFLNCYWQDAATP